MSVISTVYNGAAYFERSVPGVLGQTFAEFEWVIVDDGSSDSTPDLLRKLAARDPRVRVLSPGRLGRACALNLAASEARGEYIANQDIDDVSYDTRLQQQVAFLDAHPQIGVLGGRYLLVDENRNERYERLPPEEHAAILRAMASRIPFAHTVVTFRKQAWRDAAGYPNVPNLVDYRLWIAIGATGWRFANLPVVLGEHFVHRESFWHRHFTYKARQLDLAAAQTKAIRELGLPFWMHIYPFGRHFYGALPNGLRRFARRVLAGSRERDVPA